MSTPNSSPYGFDNQLRYLTDIELVDRLRGTCGSHEECRKATEPVRKEMVRRFIASARERNASGYFTDTPNEGKNIST